MPASTAKPSRIGDLAVRSYGPPRRERRTSQTAGRRSPLACSILRPAGCGLAQGAGGGARGALGRWGLPRCAQAALLAAPRTSRPLAQGLFGLPGTCRPRFRAIPLESISRRGRSGLSKHAGAKRVAVMGPTSRGNRKAPVSRPSLFFPQDFAAAVLYGPFALEQRGPSRPV